MMQDSNQLTRPSLLCIHTLRHFFVTAKLELLLAATLLYSTPYVSVLVDIGIDTFINFMVQLHMSLCKPSLSLLTVITDINYVYQLISRQICSAEISQNCIVILVKWWQYTAC